MVGRFFDLFVWSDDYAKKVGLAEALGWSGVCLAKEFDSGYKSFSGEVSGLRKDSGIEILAGALINPKKPEDVQKMARSALEFADLIFVSGGDEEINRAASECWEVDVLCHPEGVGGRDLMDQKNSGLDDVMVRFMAERGIAIEINFSGLLNSYGFSRAQVLGRIRQNILLAEKYDCPLIMTSGAADVMGMRTPRDLLSVLLSFEVDAAYAKKVFEYWPSMLVKKSGDRKNPNIITKGLEVVDWDDCKKTDKKKMFGWY